MASSALDADVIIVGGGAAGLAAAAALDALSLRVLLLEGRARLGGRVAASASGVDLGASVAPIEPTLARELTPAPAPVEAAPAPTTMEEAVGAESDTTAGAEAPAAEAPATEA